MPGGRFFSYQEPPERPADPAVRRANLRRITRLFVPYKLRLSAVLALIVFAAALGVVPAFLLRNLLNAIGDADSTRISYLAAGVIAIPLLTGAPRGVHKPLSNQGRQRVVP